MTTTTLTCPKCHGQMRSYERSGIVVDQCSECRGLFLDRGELERLIDLESGSVTPQADAAQPELQWPTAPPDRSWRQQQPQHRDWNSRHDWDDDSDRRSGKYPSKKKKSLLREFLDFD